ncbi:MAG: hypothetical protein C4K49_10670 [Candidatus Thorarchaeota archaeon]|nr:MAG: hypothetical protein C4K49_10670 [Candidatus Thorarchaeota archaeon]
MKFVKPSQYADLVKAKGLPMGAVRMYKNGEWFRKVGGAKGWEYVGKQGGAKAKQVVDEAKTKGLPVVMPSAQGGGQKANVVAGGAVKKPRINLGAKVHLEKWAKEDPGAFKAAVAHAINVKNPHPMFGSADIKGKMSRWDLAMMVKVAAEHGLVAPEPKVKPVLVNEAKQKREVKDEAKAEAKARAEASAAKAEREAIPEGWDKMDYGEQIVANRKLFVEQMMEARRAKWGGKPFDPKNAEDHKNVKLWMNAGSTALVNIMEAVRKDPVKEKHEASVGRAKRGNVPKSWDKMDYGEQVVANRKLFVENMLEEARKVKGDERPFDPKNADDRKNVKEWMKAGPRALVGMMEAIRKDPVKAKRQAEAKAEAEEKSIAAKKLLKEIIDRDTPKSPQEIALAQSDVVGKKNVSNGHVNVVRVLDIKSPEGKEAKAIFKPIEGECEMDLREGNIPLGEQWKRERLTYIVDQIVNIGVVPTVVVKEVDGKPGAMMDFVDGKVWAEASEAMQNKVPTLEYQKLVLLDWLICNTDRHGMNWMIDNAGKVYAIDNGLAFPEKVNFGEWNGYRCIPHQILQRRHGLELPDELKGLLTPEKKKRIIGAIQMFNLGGKAVELFEKRWDYLVKHGAFPEYNEVEGFMVLNRETPNWASLERVR